MTTINITQLSNLSKTFKPGDIILLSDGTYTDLKVNIESIGTIEKNIIIKPKNPGKVILTKTSTITMSGSYVILCDLVLKNGGSTSPAIILKGLGNRVTGFDISYTASATEQMVRIEGQQCRIDHCRLYDWNKEGVWVAVFRPSKIENFAMIDHNIFENRIPTSSTNGLECIRVGTSADSLTSSKSMIMQNKFINCNGEIEIISNKSCDNIYYRNQIENSEGTLTLRHGNNCIVNRNFFNQRQKQNSGGVRITGENHIVKNNLFSDIRGNGTTRAGISINNGMSNSPLNGYFQVKNTQIKNNIFTNCSDDYAIGVRVKSGCTLKPISTEISNTVSHHNDNLSECFSSNADCLGSDNINYINNVFHSKKIGKIQQNKGIILKDPNTFNSSDYINSLKGQYGPGLNDIVGPQWNGNSEQLDVINDLVKYYNELKTSIIAE